MLNYSLSQLTQIGISGISLGPTRPTATGQADFDPDASFVDPDASFVEVEPEPAQAKLAHDNVSAERPGLVRRRTTRRRLTTSEPSESRFSRLQRAIDRRSYTTFVAVHVDGDYDRPVYISEQVTGSSPCFAPFECHDRARQVTLTVFSKVTGLPWQQVTREVTDLTRVELARHPLPANTILLQFGNGPEEWYRTTDREPSATPRAQSYSYGQVMRLLTVTEYINDAADSIHRLRRDVTAVLERSADATDVVERCRSRADVVDRVTRAVSIKKGQIEADRERISRLKARLRRRTVGLRACQERHEEDQRARQQLCDDIAKRAEPLDLMSSEVRRVQRVLIADLCAIYPIEGSRQIRGITLPHQLDPVGIGTKEAAGLGFVAHFVLLLGHYLALPLRYPIRAAGSTSYIIDPISIMPTTSDPTYLGPPYSPRFERRYPLFAMRGAHERFAFGCFLLSKDIEQLLQGRGLVCGDLRDHLGNLTALTFWITSITEEEDRELHRRARETRSRSIEQSHERGDEIVDHADVLRASRQFSSVSRSDRVRESTSLQADGTQTEALSTETESKAAGGEPESMTQLAASLPIMSRAAAKRVAIS